MHKVGKRINLSDGVQHVVKPTLLHVQLGLALVLPILSLFTFACLAIA